MKQKTFEPFDKMIAVTPDAMLKDKTVAFYCSVEVYVSACVKLQRNVRTYKGFKIYCFDLIEGQKAYLRQKIKPMKPELFWTGKRHN